MRRHVPARAGDLNPPRREAAFRRTRRQAFAQGLARGAAAGTVAAGLTAAALTDRWLGGHHGPGRGGAPWWIVAAFGVPVAVGALVGGVLGTRGGVDADAVGLSAVPSRMSAPAAWADIRDLRAERRGRRTVVAAYLDSGRVARLRAPYDGALLGHDPDFERKFFTLQNLWETHRNARKPA